MHQPKKQYDPRSEKMENPYPSKEKREEIICKPINCVNCGKIIADGGIREGRIQIDCRHCGVSNTIEAGPRKTRARYLH